MMLQLTWAGACLVAGVLTVARHVYVEEASEYVERENRRNEDVRAYAVRGGAGLVLVALSVVVSWSSTVHPLFAWFSRVLPGAPGGLHTSAAFILTLAVALTCVTGGICVTAESVAAFTRWNERRKWQRAFEVCSTCNRLTSLQQPEAVGHEVGS